MYFLDELFWIFFIDDLLIPVSVGFPGNCSVENLTKEDKWICKANCLHLAAKYFPEGLQIIFSYFQTKDSAEMAESLLGRLILQAHVNGSTSPLHVAASNPSSLSTR